MPETYTGNIVDSKTRKKTDKAVLMPYQVGYKMLQKNTGMSMGFKKQVDYVKKENEHKPSPLDYEIQGYVGEKAAFTIAPKMKKSPMIVPDVYIPRGRELM